MRRMTTGATDVNDDGHERIDDAHGTDTIRTALTTVRPLPRVVLLRALAHGVAGSAGSASDESPANGLRAMRAADDDDGDGTIAAVALIPSRMLGDDGLTTSRRRQTLQCRRSPIFHSRSGTRRRLWSVSSVPATETTTGL